MHYTCWPVEGELANASDATIKCECNGFIITGHVSEARRAYREHVAAVVEREHYRWHQEST